MHLDGYTLVFTDTLSVIVDWVGLVAGHGILSGTGLNFATHLPVHLRRTNNAAELQVAIRALQLYPTSAIASCTNSRYVFSGAIGTARR